MKIASLKAIQYKPVFSARNCGSAEESQQCRNQDITHKLTPQEYRTYFTVAHLKEPNSAQKGNLSLGKEALKYVRNMKLESSTAMELDNPYITLAPSNDYKELRDKILAIQNRASSMPIDKHVEFVKEAVPRLGAGNCGEQAILAANYLIEDKNIENVAIISADIKGINPFNPEEPEQHAFVVTGLDKDADLSDPTTWGNEAVVIDPWSGFTAPVESDNPGDCAINRLYSKFRTQRMTFDNGAKSIGDPNLTSSSKYNWLNYQEKVRNQENI